MAPGLSTFCSMSCKWLFTFVAWLLVGTSALHSERFGVATRIRDKSFGQTDALDGARTLQQVDDDTALCYDALIFADVNLDRKVDKTEYLTYLDLYGPEDFLADDVVDFQDLPLILKSNFLILACLCLQEPDAAPDCCVGSNAHISNLGARPDETPTGEEEISLFQTCFLTETSIERYMESIQPTPTPPSLAPVVPPTMPPSVAPSTVPTAQAITPIPSPSPTIGPIPSPSTVPTSGTPMPTSGAPSLSPTDTTAPTRAVTAVPTTSPSSTPNPTTLAPTIAPIQSMMPSGANADVVAKVDYVISVAGGALRESYEADLIAAMDIVAPNVASSLNMATSSRFLLRSRRRLEVTVDVPTSMDGIIEAVCPDFVSGDDRCEDVSASIGLFLTEGENADETRAAFESDLDSAIQNGELQDALFLVNPDSPVFIVTAPQDDDDPNRSIIDDSGLSGGAISGIVVGSMLGVVLTVGLLASRRRRAQESEEYFLKTNEDVDVHEIGQNTSERKLVQNKPAAVAAGVAVAAAASTSRQSKSKETRKMDSTRVVVPASPGKQDSDAGSSGWSSREGLSSLESNADEETRASSSTGGPGAASSLGATQPDTLDPTSSRGSAPGLQMTYSELDLAIQQGDWAAVGVTAALLASQSYDTIQSGEGDKKVNFEGNLNPSRAAELDALVEAGDWAGVVAAAAKYDSQELLGRDQQGSVSSQRSESRISSGGSSGGSDASSATGPSAFSGSGTALTGGSGPFTSTGTTTSDSNSRVKKLDEIRAEVEELVEKVVPEERENLEEMLLQFRGREEELVETLRSMQEREVAQKSRVEGQKRAKRDARQAAETTRAELEQQHVVVAPPGEKVTDSVDESWMRDIDRPLSEIPSDNRMTAGTEDAGAAKSGAAVAATNSSDGQFGRLGIDRLEPPSEEDEDREVKAMQNTLKEAIDSEDWEKVAEAAAGLSGRYVEETGADNDTISDADTSLSDRNQEIDTLVDKGDWDGVVAAASKYNEGDRSVSTGDSTMEDRRARRQKRLEEEQEALEQADIWTAIAEQTKSETITSESEANKAATVAADWAIARSLSELRAADKAGKLEDSGSGEDGSGGSKHEDDDAEVGGEEGTI